MVNSLHHNVPEPNTLSILDETLHFPFHSHYNFTSSKQVPLAPKTINFP